MDTEKKLKVWEDYIEQLYNDPPDNTYKEYTNSETELEITREQIEHMIKEMRLGKPKGTEKLPTEIIILINDNNLIKVDERICKSGIIAG